MAGSRRCRANGGSGPGKAQCRSPDQRLRRIRAPVRGQQRLHRPEPLLPPAGHWSAGLTVYGPYALLMLIALAGYATLNWQLRYLASALILGPSPRSAPA